MASPAYFLTYDSTGTITGNGYTPDGTFPPNSIVCTQAQYQSYRQYAISNGEIVSAPSSVLLAQAQAAQSNIIRTSYNSAIASVTISPYTIDMTPTHGLIWMSSVLTTESALRGASVWTASTAVASGGFMTVNGELLVATVGGTTGTTVPTVPAIGETVIDGTVTWQLFAHTFDFASGPVTLSASQVMSLFYSVEAYLGQQRTTLHTLLNNIQAATTVAEVQAIVWPSS